MGVGEGVERVIVLEKMRPNHIGRYERGISGD